MDRLLHGLSNIYFYKYLKLAIYCTELIGYLGYSPISGVESVIGSMSPTIVEKIVIASRIVTPDKLHKVKN